MDLPLHILIIEDSPDDAALLKRILRSNNPNISFTVIDKSKDLQVALDEQDWDAIVADYQLPGFNALGALKIVQERRLDLPFIVVSGTVGEDVAVEIMKAGAHDYVMKHNLARLPAALDRELREAAGRRERRRAEQALRESELRYRLLAENATDMIGRYTAEGQCLYVSPACRTLLGYEPQEMIRRSANDFIHPDDIETINQSHRSIQRQPLVNTIEYRIRKKDGSYTWFETTSKAIQAADAEDADEIVTISRDITVRRHLEDRLRQAEKMEAIGQLAGGVAHDFNNLLTVIIGYSNLLVQGLKDEALRTDVIEIRTAAKRAADLTAQLLAYSRRQMLQPRILDLNLIIEESARLLSRLIGENIELVLVLKANAGKVNADPGQLNQVLMNLAINARDAMPKGGKLTIETTNVELDEEYANQHIGTQPGSYVMMAMSDNGRGISREIQARIFEPFFTTKEMGKGTGLGLSTVYGIVKQSGGNIWVYSEPGLGTTFKVYLPRVQEAVQEAPTRSVLQAEPGGETILLVEDEDDVRRLITNVLMEAGYQVISTPSGFEALERCENFEGTIHLMVTDVVLPKMSGSEVAERAMLFRPGMKVLYISGYTDAAIVQHGVLEAGREFLQKPFTPDDLVHKVIEVLKKETPRTSS